MVQGPASQKIRFWVDEKGGGDELTTLDGLQVSLCGSVNGNGEIAKEFESSEANFKQKRRLSCFGGGGGSGYGRREGGGGGYSCGCDRGYGSGGGGGDRYSSWRN
ncbi:glycine-rich RNA-binding protein 2-like [Telopea speciosissima]|uniref:glycine-rich RNA-binding protein 2-like n=1 Tax=Telopea speciosissima TaxID=54955 RepID=UPI001CC3D82E|nr:glycine-rich RNA-binding protein 2-like [Telopea speciosissima]